MRPVATVLYEDKMQAGKGGYPLHDLVLAMVCDARPELAVFALRERVRANPRNGVGNILNDVRTTSVRHAGGDLHLLIDRDKVARHLGLPKDADASSIRNAIHARTDASDRVFVHFLHPNMEGLLSTIATCVRTERVPSSKDHIVRDTMLNRAAFGHSRADRACIARHQPGLAALVTALDALP